MPRTTTMRTTGVDRLTSPPFHSSNVGSRLHGQPPAQIEARFSIRSGPERDSASSACRRSRWQLFQRILFVFLMKKIKGPSTGSDARTLWSDAGG